MRLTTIISLVEDKVESHICIHDILDQVLHDSRNSALSITEGYGLLNKISLRHTIDSITADYENGHVPSDYDEVIDYATGKVDQCRKDIIKRLCEASLERFIETLKTINEDEATNLHIPELKISEPQF